MVPSRDGFYHQIIRIILFSYLLRLSKLTSVEIIYAVFYEKNGVFQITVVSVFVFFYIFRLFIISFDLCPGFMLRIFIASFVNLVLQTLYIPVYILLPEADGVQQDAITLSALDRCA